MKLHSLIWIWKTYLIVWIVFRSFTLGTRLLFDPGLHAASYVALGVLGFIPIIGFVATKPILKANVWLIWLLLILVWMPFDTNFYAAWFLQPPLDHPYVGILLAVPAIAATYFYSRPAYRAWNL